MRGQISLFVAPEALELQRMRSDVGVEALLAQEDIWAHILQFLSVRDMSGLAAVSTSFAMASSDNAAWGTAVQHSFTPLTGFVFGLAGFSDQRLPTRSKADYMTIHVVRKELIRTIGVEDAVEPVAVDEFQQTLEALQRQQTAQIIGHLIFGPFYYAVAAITPLLFLLFLGLKLQGLLHMSWRLVFTPLLVLCAYSMLNAWAAVAYYRMGTLGYDFDYQALSRWSHYHVPESAGAFFVHVMPFLVRRLGKMQRMLCCAGLLVLTLMLTVLAVVLPLKLDGVVDMSYARVLVPLWIAFIYAALVIGVNYEHYLKQVAIVLLFEVGQLLAVILLVVVADGSTGLSTAWAIFPAFAVGCVIMGGWTLCRLRRYPLFGALFCWTLSIALWELEVDGSTAIGPLACMSPLLLLAAIWLVLGGRQAICTAISYWDDIATVQFSA